MMKLTREQALEGLERLGRGLGSLGLEGELVMAGGATKCLVRDAREISDDIDALYMPKEAVSRLVAKISRELGLSPRWLNDSVSDFIMPDPPKELFLTFPGLKVYTVTPRYLLAMKLMSHRDIPDVEDAAFLMLKLGVRTFGAVAGLLRSFYGEPDLADIPEQTVRAILRFADDMEKESGGGPPPD
jgi:hypothetical protein